MGSKWVEILKEIAPGVTRAAVLMHDETAANVAMSPAPPRRAGRRSA